jgi:hypothetical protein
MFLALGAYKMQCAQISVLVPETGIECLVRHLLKFRQKVDLSSTTSSARRRDAVAVKLFEDIAFGVRSLGLIALFANVII